MYYASLIKNLPETLCQPLSWATLASLGLHGLLWAVLPLLPLHFKSAEPQRTVGLVALTQADQSRLPQVSTPPVNLPPLTTQSNVLPPLPLTPYPKLLQPPLVNLPSVLPPLPPAPLGNNQSMTQLVPIPGQPPNVLPPLPSAPLGNNQSITQLVPIAGKPPSELNQRINYNQQNMSQLEHQQISRASSKTTLSTASARLARSPKHWTRKKLLTALRGGQLQPNSSSTATATSASTLPENIPKHWTREKLLTALRGGQPQLNSGSTATATTASTLPASTPPKYWTEEKLVAALQEQPQPDSGSLSAATAQIIAEVNDFKEWYQKVHQVNPKLATKATIRQKLKTCNKQLDSGVAVFGVVVNPEGKIIFGPDFIPKNSAANIQQAAKDYIKRYRFQKTVKATVQPFRLEFEYGTGKCSAP